MGAITKERWDRAQKAERQYHTQPKDVLIKMYDDAYRQYFEWLGIDRDLKGKSIIEVGPADVPALYYCGDKGAHSIIIEPMPSSVLEELSSEKCISTVIQPAEYVKYLDSPNWKIDEVWIFNVLQHVMDPDKVVANCKKWAKTIRFFEPIDMGTTEAHPHSFTLDDFKGWFGDSAKLYDYNNDAVGFHQNRCAYGVWEK